jgi:hypothetical protein
VDKSKLTNERRNLYLGRITKTLNEKIKNMKKILLILLLAPLSMWGQVNNADLKDVFSFNVKTGYIYTLKVDVSNPNDTTVIVYEPSAGIGVSIIPQNSNTDFKTEIMSGRWTVTTYKIAYFRSIINTFELTDPKVVEYKAQIGNLNAYIQDRVSLSNRIKQASGVPIIDTMMVNKIDSLERFIATDLVKMRDTMRIINAKFAAMELKEKLKDSTLIVAGGATVLTLNSARNILVRNVGAISTITLPSPIGHKEEFIIKRDLGSIGRVDITCATASIVANQATTTAALTIQLATRPLYGHTMKLKSNGITWQLQ